MGTDFAYAGARSGTGGTDFIIPNLLTQIDCYLMVTGGTASPTALYTIWAGGNDVIDYIGDGMPNTPAAIEPFTDMMAANLSTAVTTLHNGRGKKLPGRQSAGAGRQAGLRQYAEPGVRQRHGDVVQSQAGGGAGKSETAACGAASGGVGHLLRFQSGAQRSGQLRIYEHTDAAFSSSGPYPGTVVPNPNQHVFWDGTHPTAPGHLFSVSLRIRPCC